jgi:hypothetical protein
LQLFGTRGRSIKEIAFRLGLTRDFEESSVVFKGETKFSTFANSLQENNKSENEIKLSDKKDITIKNLIENLKIKFLSGTLLKPGLNSNINIVNKLKTEKANKISTINDSRKPFQFSSVFLRNENRFSMNHKKIKDTHEKNNFISRITGSNRFSNENNSIGKLEPIKEYVKDQKLGNNSLITNSQIKLKKQNNPYQRSSAVENRKSNLKLSKFKFSVKDFSSMSLEFTSEELKAGGNLKKLFYKFSSKQ